MQHRPVYGEVHRRCELRSRKVTRVLPRVRLLAGENHRERVLSFAEEKLYLEAAVAIGHGIEDAYERALRAFGPLCEDNSSLGPKSPCNTSHNL